MRGREAPLPYSLDSAIVQPRAEPLQDPDLADRSIMPHDDLEKHVARNAATARVVGIVGLHLAEQTGRLDAAAGPIGSAAGAAPGSGADSAAIAFAEPGAFARSGAAGTGRREKDEAHRLGWPIVRAQRRRARREIEGCQEQGGDQDGVHRAGHDERYAARLRDVNLRL